MLSLAEKAAQRPSRRGRYDLLPGVMIGAASVAVLTVVVLLGVILWLSFSTGTPADRDLRYTLANYADVFLDPFTYTVLGNTLLFSFITLAVALAIALPVAWLMERTDFPAKSLVFTLLTVALLLPGFSVALGWLFLLNPNIGLINRALMSLFGLQEAPFNVSTIPGMGIIQGVSLAPVTFIMTAVVLRSMDSSLEEAARTSGANLRETIRRVTLPLAWPGIMAASIYVFTLGFAVFDIPAILGYSQRIFTFSTYVVNQVNPTEALPAYNRVAALSVIMVALAVVLSWWYGTMQRRAPRFAVVAGKAYRPTIFKLGPFKWVAVAFVAAYFLVGQGLPILTLAWAAGLPFLQPVSFEAMELLSFNNFLNLPRDVIASAMRNTALLMLIVPSCTVLLSLGVSWVVLRSRLRGRGVFDFLAFLPHTVPTIVFSVSAWLFALFVLRDVLPIYGTIWILVGVYVVVWLSYGTRMINSALIQIHRELEESATVAGASTGGILRAVLIPLLMPAMLYSWIWVALLSFRELTLAVVLSAGENTPLSAVVWSLVQTAQFGQASAVALIMVGLMFPILVLYWTVARRTGIAPSG